MNLCRRNCVNILHKKQACLMEKHGQFVKSGNNFTTRWQHCLLLPHFCISQSSLILKTNCKEICTPWPMQFKNRGDKTSAIRWFGEMVTSGKLICQTRYFKPVKGYSFCKGTDKTSFLRTEKCAFYSYFLSLRMIKRARGEAFKVGILGSASQHDFCEVKAATAFWASLGSGQSVLSYKVSRLG